MKKILFYFTLIAITVLVAFTAWLVRPSQYQHKTNHTKQSYQTAERLVELPPKIQSSNNSTQEYTEREVEEWAAARSDLAAQWNMADTAFIGLCVGALGLFFIAWTLVETRSAAKAASETLRVTQIALDDARKHARMELQPVITIEGVKFDFGDHRNFPNKDEECISAIVTHTDKGSFARYRYIARIEVKNWGVTPIYMLRFSGQNYLLRANKGYKPPVIYFNYLAGSVSGGVDIIAPNDTVTINVVCMFDIEITKKENTHTFDVHDLFIQMVGDINFHDGFTIHLEEYQDRLFSFKFSDWFNRQGQFTVMPEELSRDRYPPEYDTPK